MKKLLFLILFIPFTTNLIAQEYSIHLFGKNKSEGDACAVTGVEYYIVYDDDSQEFIDKISSRDVFEDFDFTLVRSQPIKQVRVRAYREVRRGVFARCRNTNSGERFIDLSPNYCDSQYWEQLENDPSDFFYNTSFFAGDLTIEYKPIVNLIQPSNNLVGFDDLMSVAVENSSQGFSSSVYNWQYQVVENFSNLTESGWENMPASVQGKSSFTITPSSFLNETDLNQKIYFRINMCDNLVSENIIFYDLRLSAPHIVSTILAPTTCFDADDGTVTIQFERPLKLDELLSISLQNTTNSFDYSVANIATLDSGNSYTITGLPIGDYELSLLGLYNGINTYIGGSEHSDTFTITRPTPVEFTVSKVDVWCTGGEDGEIAITALGGEGNYEYVFRNQGETTENWLPFSTVGTHRITGLAPGIYEVLVRDDNGCYAKDIVTDGGGNIVGLGNVIIKTIEITEPEAPVAITYTYSQEPTGYGFSNGQIVAKITGGTPLLGGVYNYTWTYEDGTVWTDVSTLVNSEGYFLTLNNAPSGTYTLAVSDANYNEAIDKNGCTIENSEFELTQPNPLQVVLSVYQEISCHVDNEFGDETDIAPSDGQRDESQDGAILATVTGGVQFSSGTPYIYTWKKQNTDGTWEIITNQTNNIAIELSDGNYAFNVKDAKGVVLGTYENNILIEETDSVMYLHEPPKLELNLASTPATCASGVNGSITATVIGGTPPYMYYWSNGETGTIPTLMNLTPNNYFVQIVDSKGCQVQGSIEVEQPDDYYVKVIEQINPTCFEGNDGEINIDVLGGAPPYTYNWNTGDTTEDINDLEAGTYTVTITDVSGCVLYQEFVIEDPDEISIDLGGDRTLCNEQSLFLDATIEDAGAIYQWTSDNGFSSDNPQIEVSQAGIYRIKAITSLGCIVEDEITITTSNQDISSEFLLSSQAYVDEEVILINVSNPRGETTEWIIPSNVTINKQSDDNIQLVFSETGSYEIGLRSTQGDCFEEYHKNIVVEESTELPNPGDADNPFIIEFTLTPNPNNGTFQIIVALAEESPISIRLFNYVGELVSIPRNESGSDTYVLDFKETVATGTYLVVLETAKGTQVKRMIRF